MAEFIKVASATDIPDPGRVTLELDQRVIVLFHIDDQWYCIDDVCTHDGGPLGDGALDGHCIACPRHGALFDVRSGKALSMPATEATACHKVKVEGDNVLVCLADD